MFALFLTFTQYPGIHNQNYTLFLMKEKRNKPRYNGEFKTFNSQQSCIDVFSKVQGLFLQKFFRYNISDYFHDQLVNVEEDLFLRKLKNKQIKQISSECFLTKTPLQLVELEQRVNKFYSHKVQGVEASQNPLSFKLLFSNCQDKLVPKDELVFVQVRIRAEIEKIQNLPNYFYKELELCQEQMRNITEGDEQQVLKQLKKYGKNVINLFVVYFGDINFHLFNKEQYSLKKVAFFNKQVEVRIHVFYISRIALLTCFRKINKIQNMEYINDLLIQLYEFKREKARNKRLKNSRSKNLPPPRPSNERMMRMLWYLKWFGIISVTVVGIGALILRFFF